MQLTHFIRFFASFLDFLNIHLFIYLFYLVTNLPQILSILPQNHPLNNLLIELDQLVIYAIGSSCMVLYQL